MGSSRRPPTTTPRSWPTSTRRASAIASLTCGCSPTTALGEIDGQIDVLYVDGAHRYAPARADIRDWGRRVRPGGTLLIHDSFSSIGVTLAILRELAFGGRFRYVGRARSLTTYRADLRGGRFANAGRQLAQLPWFVKNVALKVALKLGLGKVLRTLRPTRAGLAVLSLCRVSAS